MSTNKGHSRLFNTETDILLLLQPASDLVQSLLKDVVVHCMSCNIDMRAGVYEDTNVQLLTLSSEKMSSSWVTEKGHHPINLLLGETYVYSMSTTLKCYHFCSTTLPSQ